MLKNTIFASIIYLFISCKSSNSEKFDRFPEGKSKNFITVDGIDLKDPDLQLTLFAKEPLLYNPTNMDIDHKGRIWVCEAYNYRNDVNNVPYRKKGDQILILEDTNGDGEADKSKVYYQGEDVNSALGISVLGNKTIVSCSPNVLVFTDENGDDIPDKKEVLFKTIGGFQSDHGLHSFVFGPDGKLYFNFGNFGAGLLDKNNQPIKDIYGRVIDQTKAPFQDGMAVRCDIDGRNFEVLGWNFRNNYELCVDSYGRIWQSDNDDDGKRSNRINYLLPNGNYGYKDEMTGADWRVARTNQEDSIFFRHWHQNDPGVVPNLHQTFAGSPTGIFIYEGQALPQKYQNSLFLADAGTNEVTSYEIRNSGAGYSLGTNTILDATDKDLWFRPSDICAAPDGSVFVADWYDSGVGGHFIGDLERGRIYRIATKGSKYSTPKYDFNSAASCTLALQNPSNSIRYLAFNSLVKMEKKAEQNLVELLKNSNPVVQARALWILGKLDKKYIIDAAKSTNEQIRALSVRLNSKDKEFLIKMSKDASDQVKQAVAIALYHQYVPEAWLNLANNYKSGDRWFLEALGIAAEGNWDTYLEKYLQGKNWINDKNTKDIIWRSRSKKTSEYLVKIIENGGQENKQRYFRSFDFINGKEKNVALLRFLKSTTNETFKLLIFKHFQKDQIMKNKEFNIIAPKIISSIKNEKDFLEIVLKYNLQNQSEKVNQILMDSDVPEIYEMAANVLTQLAGVVPLKDIVNLKPMDEKKVIKAIQRIGLVDNDVITRQLILIFSNTKLPFRVREAAMLAMQGYMSDVKLWNLMKVNKVSKELIPAAKIVLSKTYHNDIKVQFEQKYGKSQSQIISMNVGFLSKKGDVSKGKELFNMYCTACHVVNGNGMDFGPGLSQIGKKLTKESIYNAIVNPNQGISFGYEGYTITLTDGSSFQGLITSKTSDEFQIKMPGRSDVVAYKKNQIKSVTQMDASIMPAFPLMEQEYLDLIEYLSGLK